MSRPTVKYRVFIIMESCVSLCLPQIGHLTNRETHYTCNRIHQQDKITFVFNDRRDGLLLARQKTLPSFLPSIHMYNLQMQCTDGENRTQREVYLKLTSVFSDLQAVSNKSAFCLKTHEQSTYLFDFVIQQWRRDIGHGTHVILGKLNMYMRKLLTWRCNQQ